MRRRKIEPLRSSSMHVLRYISQTGYRRAAKFSYNSQRAWRPNSTALVSCAARCSASISLELTPLTAK